MKKLLCIILSLFLFSSCAKTHHLTLYSGKPFDRSNFSVNTNNKGKPVEGEVTSRVVLFYIPAAENTFSGNKLGIAASRAQEKTESQFLIDPYIRSSWYGILPPFCLYCEGHITLGGYESID